MSVHHRHARNRRGRPPHAQHQHAERLRGSDELRVDVERVGGLLKLALIPATDDAADRLDALARENSDMQTAIVAAMLSHVQRAFEDPAHQPPCVLCTQRLDAEQVAWFAILHAHADEPLAGLARFVCVQCARPYRDPFMLGAALEPRLQRELGGKLRAVTISPPGRA
jgi:hypothetical protein